MSPGVLKDEGGYVFRMARGWGRPSKPRTRSEPRAWRLNKMVEKGEEAPVWKSAQLRFCVKDNMCLCDNDECL